MTAQNALELKGITKRFGATLALDSVDLSLAYGKIHALLGHNGSGKSTVVKILAGYHNPDAGTVVHDGVPITYPMSQLDLAERGITFLHQDIGLVESASVLDNIFIGRYATGLFGNIRRGPARTELRAQLHEFGARFDPDIVVSRLSPSERTLVGLIRALHDLEHHYRGVLVLDEATAALPVKEVKELLSAVRLVADRGIAVLLVTHHLNEPVALADEVTVLRDGKVVASQPIAGLDESDLAELVVGQSRGVINRRSATTREGTRFEVAEIAARRALHPTSFSVAPGEIVGLTGLSGSGHDSVLSLAFGLRRPDQGRAFVDGHEFSCSPATARKAGLALVSGDRARAGGVVSASLTENIGTPNLRLNTGFGSRILRSQERALVERVVERFGIRPRLQGLPFSALSGGNQQKALVARFMVDPPHVLLLDEPTSGVDIAAVDEILSTLSDYAADGGSVVIATTQLDDIARLADRVLVFVDQRVAVELEGEEISPHRLLVESYGGTDLNTIQATRETT